MLRVLLSALLGAGVLVAALDPAPAQQPKEKKKGPPRVAVDDPQKAAEDPDFAVQGEYLGELTTPDGKVHKAGAHVIAQGGGQFVTKIYAGGLPGDGFDGKTTTDGWARALRKGAGSGGELPKPAPGKHVGVIQDGKYTIEDATGIKGTFTKTERKSPTRGAKPPEGAVVLFAGPGDEANWTGGKLITLSDGKFLNYGIKSKKAFGSCKAHVEFRLPWMPNSRGQGRANSGVYVQDRYEIQVLDSFGLKGENNECGGVYTQHKPLVNMCYPPMTWQTYDIEFTAAEFDGDKKVKPARLTVLHNGVKVQDNVELKGPTGGGQPEGPKPGPFQLQNHGDPLVYRNIWVVETK